MKKHEQEALKIYAALLKQTGWKETKLDWFPKTGYLDKSRSDKPRVQIIWPIESSRLERLRLFWTARNGRRHQPRLVA